MHGKPCTRQPGRQAGRGRWTLVSGIALIAVGVLSFNAYASFTATQSYNQDIGTGTMSLTLANETTATINYNLAGANLAPGDTMQRGLLLTFGGTVSAASLTLSASDASPTALDDGTANGLTLTIQACSQKWDETVTSGIPTYACAGSTSSVLAATAVSTVIATPQVLTTNLALGGANHLKLTWTLPSGAGNAFQNLSDTIALTLASNQRAATNK